MPYGYQYGQSGGLKSVTPGSPYRSLFPSSGGILMQILQQKRAQQAIEAAERKRGQEIADTAWRDAAKYNPNPARSEYQDYFKTQTSQLMDTASNSRRGKVSPDEVYRKLGSIESDVTKVDRFDKEANLAYTRYKDTGYRNMGVIDKEMANHVYDIPLSGQMGVKVVKHPEQLDVDGLKHAIDNNPDSYSSVKLTEDFVKKNIEPLLQEKISYFATPFDKIRMEQSQALPSELVGGYLPSGKPRIIIGDIGSPNANQLLAQWEAMSPDHAKYLDLLVQRDNPTETIPANKNSIEYGMLKQRALQNVLDESGHIQMDNPKSQLISRGSENSASEAAALEKKKLFDLKAKVIYDLYTGDANSALTAAKNLEGVGTDGVRQSVKYDHDNNQLVVTIQRPPVSSPWGGTIPSVPVKEVIDLNDPSKGIPLIQSLWQRVSPVKSEVDTQAIMDAVNNMGIQEKARKPVRGEKSPDIMNPDLSGKPLGKPDVEQNGNIFVWDANKNKYVFSRKK